MIDDSNVTERKKSEKFKNNNIFKFAPYDGKGPSIDYKSHVDACSQINSWTETEKGLYLKGTSTV